MMHIKLSIKYECSLLFVGALGFAYICDGYFNNSYLMYQASDLSTDFIIQDVGVFLLIFWHHFFMRSLLCSFCFDSPACFIAVCLVFS